MSEASDRWSWTDAVERISWFLIRLSRARSANKAFRSIPDRCWSWQWPLRDVFFIHTCVTRRVHCFSRRLACQKPVNNYKLDIQSCLWILSVFYHSRICFLSRAGVCVFSSSKPNSRFRVSLRLVREKKRLDQQTTNRLINKNSLDDHRN